MRRIRAHSRLTREAAKLLGGRIRVARIERRWTLAELAERIGVTQVTMRKIERGDLSVALGTAFEAAAVVGVPLFDDDAGRRRLEAGRVEDRLAVLPKAVHRPVAVNDDF